MTAAVFLKAFFLKRLTVAGSKIKYECIPKPFVNPFYLKKSLNILLIILDSHSYRKINILVYFLVDFEIIISCIKLG